MVYKLTQALKKEVIVPEKDSFGISRSTPNDQRYYHVKSKILKLGLISL